MATWFLHHAETGYRKEPISFCFRANRIDIWWIEIRMSIYPDCKPRVGVMIAKPSDLRVPKSSPGNGNANSIISNYPIGPTPRDPRYPALITPAPPAFFNGPARASSCVVAFITIGCGPHPFLLCNAVSIG